MNYMKHRNGKVYERWISPLALKKVQERNAVWRKENREKALQARRDWFQRNKAHHYAYMKEWKQRKTQEG